jgi:Zn finger protein HypA/HybF involved in hydrogenase expression
VVDVVVHAWKGEGQACRACGHFRPVKSFRFAGPCPQCGE